MATVVVDCPRCGAARMTFDVLADTFRGTQYGWMSMHEVAVQCRRCQRLSILRAHLHGTERSDEFKRDGTLSKLEGDLEPTFDVKGFLNVGDLAGLEKAPDHVPGDVTAAFDEGAKCMSIGCHNAAAAMFRLCLDLTTKPLLPDPADTSVPQPTKPQRYKLGERIDWLIANQRIPEALKDLAHGVREDANDGVHDGSLGETDATDLLEFTVALLERLFTEPTKLKLAAARREERRAAPNATEGRK